jgi:hypothetical protein
VKKLADLMSEIVTSTQEEMSKIASDRLSNQNTPPTISTDLGQALVKTAAVLREANADVSYEDIRKLMEHIRNA